MMLRRTSVAAFLVFASILTACGSPAAEPEAASASETVPSSPTVRVPRQVDQSDRPWVVFDPCLDIPDEALVEAGYDPESKDEDAVAADYHTFLICNFDTPQRQYGLGVFSANITFAEEQEKVKDYSTPIEFDGRRALRKTSSTISCAISMETSYGILIVSRLIQLTRSDQNTEEERCVGIEETASIIARYLPERERELQDAGR
ncbi:hypothetical protein BFN03_03805 [Rhodococcus sp. WMMA185]|uniref:DUF3558 family protein n=1 Tax=Rhodococcus sp. WMMA185 TaxID=679318 RepID=UPI00087A339F|nr:DUF3558 family protein [Rhodococcus sp. WMMA185]AOW92122.1 hypothetical protein BFN03_03805 [Rhodococcus sp. WMMA185]